MSKAYPRLLREEIEKLHREFSKTRELKPFSDIVRPEWKTVKQRNDAYLVAGEFFWMVADGVLDSKNTNPLQRAFRETQLDATNPIYWYYLLSAFANIHYSPRKSPRETKRTKAFYRELQKDADEIRRLHPTMKKPDICEELLKITASNSKDLKYNCSEEYLSRHFHMTERTRTPARQRSK